MKFIKFSVFFLFGLTCFTTYGNENKYIFVGQNENEGTAKTAFVLELIGEDLNEYFQINDNGEVYLRVDKILAIPKETFSHFVHLAETSSTAFPDLGQLNNHYREQEVWCRKCKRVYYPRPGDMDCPGCGTRN